ncbi:MAG: hypothetical protein ABSH13_13420 [Candidatus Acidiferrum sp.]|jgi:hypothetical protein
MKRIFSHPFAALAAGLCLRLFFVLKYPANSGDTVLYEQMATNWLKHHVYAMEVFGQITPVDLRMPGYPVFLALVYAITGRTGPDARLWVMIVQAVVDLFSCVLIAVLAATLLLMVNERNPPGRVFMAALWLAALCPFTANYAAVTLTEVFAILFTAAALLPLCLLVGRTRNNGWLFIKKDWRLANSYTYLAALAALLVGLGTLFRPETPLLLFAAWVVLGFVLVSQHEAKRWLRTVAGMGLLCAVPLLPWAVRNAVTLHEFQFLAPKNSNLPGELVPYGFMSWEKTWLYRFRDVYLVPWKLNDEAIRIEDIPARAFDTPEERERVAAILEPYNNDLTLTPEEDQAFGELARQRTARHPLRTYVWLPVARAATMWFTPRIELIPVSGTVFPLVQSWEDDKIDQSVTVGLFLLNLVYVGLAIWGAARLWRQSGAVRPAVAVLIVFILLRTAFLTTLETPEPRYVLVCFPALIALAAQIFSRPAEP